MKDPDGKSWKAASGKTGSGKRCFHSVIAGAALRTEPIYVATIMPMIQYCMGSLEIEVKSAVESSKGRAIQGSYAAAKWQVVFMPTAVLVATL